MKTITLALALLLCTSVVYSQKKSVAKTTAAPEKKPDALTLFKAVVAKVDATFKQSPTVFKSSPFDSPSGYVYYKLQFEEVESSYDVQASNSLVSPYIGYILLKVRVKSNANSGDLKSSGITWRFSDSAKARENDLFESCSSGMDVNEWCTGDIKINYVYQDNKWVFKSIETETEKRIMNGVTRGDIEKGIIDKFFKQ